MVVAGVEGGLDPGFNPKSVIIVSMRPGCVNVIVFFVEFGRVSICTSTPRKSFMSPMVSTWKRTFRCSNASLIVFWMVPNTRQSYVYKHMIQSSFMNRYWSIMDALNPITFMM